MARIGDFRRQRRYGRHCVRALRPQQQHAIGGLIGSGAPGTTKNAAIIWGPDPVDCICSTGYASGRIAAAKNRMDADHWGNTFGIPDAVFPIGKHLLQYSRWL
jgi:hypothetical protein